MNTLDNRRTTPFLLTPALVAALLLLPTAARAEAPDASDVPEWSFGVGAGLVLAGQSVVSRGHVERRIGERTALSLDIAAGYQAQHYDDLELELGSASGSMGVGVRWLWNQVGPVLVSFTSGISFGYDWSEGGEQVPPDYQMWTKTFRRAYGPSVGAGVAFDLPLLEGLSLRMASTVLRAAYTLTEGDAQPYMTPNGTRWSAGLAFEPSLQLRIEL